MEMEKSKESQLWLKLRALEPINANAKKKRHLYSCLMLAIHVCFIKSLINLENTPKKSPTIINNMPWLHAYLQPKKQNQTAHFRLINEIPNGRGYAPFQRDLCLGSSIYSCILLIIYTICVQKHKKMSIAVGNFVSLNKLPTTQHGQCTISTGKKNRIGE